MYKLRTKNGKRDPLKRWALPERVFFALQQFLFNAMPRAEAYLRRFPAPPTRADV